MANLRYIPISVAPTVDSTGESLLPWDSTNAYKPYTIVKSSANAFYISVQAVPANTLLSNTSYWVPFGSGSSSAVTGVKGNAESAYRTGNVNLTPANLGAAPLASPTFTGVPKAPTASIGDRTTQIATTDFVQNAIEAHLPIDLSEGGFGANISNVAARNYFGNHSGTAGSPSFDTLSASDIIDGILPVARGGTGASSAAPGTVFGTVTNQTTPGFFTLSNVAINELGGTLRINKGGTGATGVSSNETTIANVITASSNVTVTLVNYRTWGKMAQLLVGFKPAASWAANASLNVGTIVSGKRPVVSTMCGWLNNVGYLDTAGTLTVRNVTSGAIGISTTVYVSASYLLP